MGKGCVISDQAHVGYHEHGGKIILGNKVVIRHDALLRTCTGIITLGDNVVVNYGCILHGFGNITIGKNSLLSPTVQIYAQNHGIKREALIRDQPQTHKGVVIGEDVWVGAGAIIIDGVTLGDGVVVGAGSVVSTSFGPYAIIAGNPAVQIGERK
jgi:acetyltransferase-like isoleucine patch superfamily enzyme